MDQDKTAKISFPILLIKYATQQLLLLGTQQILTSTIIKINNAARKFLLTNIAWNILFILILFINKFVFTFELLIIYYTVNNGLMIYSIIKLYKKLNQIPNLIHFALPNFIIALKQFIITMLIIFFVQQFSMIFNLSLDILIYSSAIIINLYILPVRRLGILIINIGKILKINKQLRKYAFIFLIENIITIGIFIGTSTNE